MDSASDFAVEVAVAVAVVLAVGVAGSGTIPPPLWILPELWLDSWLCSCSISTGWVVVLGLGDEADMDMANREFTTRYQTCTHSGC